MRLLLKILAGIFVFVATAVAAGAGWFFLYSRDLPIRQIAKFAPASAEIITDDCSGKQIVAIPYAELGRNLQLSLIAAEAASPDRAPRIFAVQVARISFCGSSKMLTREIKEWRTSEQLRLKFTPEELMTIYANRTYFGDDLIGIEAAAQHFYGRHASELDLAQAATIAGLPWNPRSYSPVSHPDKAKQRRDHVLDVLLAQGAITSAQADAAKATPVLHTTRVSPAP